MKWHHLFLLLSSIFIAPHVGIFAGVIFGLIYLAVAIYAGIKDE